MIYNHTQVKATEVLVFLANLAVGGIGWASMWDGMTRAKSLLTVKKDESGDNLYFLD